MPSHESPSLETDNVIAAVSQLGIGGNSPSVDAEFDGGECRIFKLSFRDQEDSSSIAVRVQHPAGGGGNHDGTTAALRTEARVLRHPFIVLTWAEGSPLRWDEHFPPRPRRDALLGQAASIQLCMIGCTLESGTRERTPGRRAQCAKADGISHQPVPGPTTASAFFEHRLETRTARVLEGKIPELSKQDCLDQQALLDRLLGRDRSSTDFAIDHGDIKPGNIIVDESFSIKCIIDWGFAALVPLAKVAAALHRFLWPDRSAQLAPSLQNAEGVDFRTLYLDSIFSKGMHISMARVGWKLPYYRSPRDEESP